MLYHIVIDWICVPLYKSFSFSLQRHNFFFFYMLHMSIYNWVINLLSLFVVVVKLSLLHLLFKYLLYPHATCSYCLIMVNDLRKNVRVETYMFIGKINVGHIYATFLLSYRWRLYCSCCKWLYRWTVGITVKIWFS